MITIWGRKNSSNVQKVLWTLDELGLEYKNEIAGGSFGRLETEEFKKMNPNKRVPVLQDGETVLWESHSIIRYLAHKYGIGKMWDKDLKKQALADQWMEWVSTCVMESFYIIFIQLIRTPKAAQQPEKIAQASADIGKTLQIANEHLSQHQFFAGSEFSIADIPLSIVIYRYFHLNVERPQLPALELWYEKICEREAFRKNVMLPFGSNLEEWKQYEQQYGQ